MMGHDHSHGHQNRRRLLGALIITSTILLAEIVGAALTNSLALLVDAAHMLTDSLGLAVAFTAATLMARPTSSRRTWGWLRLEVLAAAVQGGILLAVGIYALVEGVGRLFAPPEVMSQGLLVVGAIGLAGNIVSLLILSGGRDANLNMRAAFLEVMADALGSVAVVVSALVMMATGWSGVDAIAGILVAALIIPRSFILLRKTGGILLESTPEGLDLDAVRNHMLTVDHVIDVHDLHASLIGTDLPVVSAHVVVDESCFTDGHALEILDQLRACLATHHDVAVEHSTFQLETASLAAEHEQRMHAL